MKDPALIQIWAQRLAEAQAEIDKHKCGASWCPGHDIACERAGWLLNEEWKATESLLGAVLGDEGYEAATRKGQERAKQMSIYRTEAVRDVLAERERQTTEEGFTPDHDDKYTHDELPRAAACYAMPIYVEWQQAPICWPWLRKWWKGGYAGERRRDLVKAAALLLAEIERIDRAGDDEPT